MQNGNTKCIEVPDVTTVSNCIVQVNTDKSLAFIPLSEADMGVTLETLARNDTDYTLEDSTLVTTEITTFYSGFDAKATGTYDITVQFVLYVDDTSIFDEVTTTELCSIELASDNNTDTFYIMNLTQNIVNVKLTVPLKINNIPTLTFNLGKQSVNCKILGNYGKCVLKRYSAI